MKNIFAIILLALLITINSKAQVLHNNGATLFINTGSILQVNGGLTNTSGSTLKNDGKIIVTGNTTNDQVMAMSDGGTLVFNGNSAQSLNGSSIYFAKNAEINNAAGVTLNKPLKIDGECKFIDGIIITNTVANALNFTTNGTVSTTNAPSDASHVNGYVTKEGTGSFTFPVGDGSKYQPAGVNLTANSAGLTVSYNPSDAGTGTFGTTGASSVQLEAYNDQEYWDLDPIGTAEGSVTIYWDEYKGPTVSDTRLPRVAHRSGGSWLNEGASSTTGTTTEGSVTSLAVSTWSPFTMGTISPGELPVTLVSFTTQKAEHEALLRWQTTSEINASHFEVQRSFDARKFETLGTLAAKGDNNGRYSYNFSDPLANLYDVSMVYYRLRMVDLDGSYAVSRVVSLNLNDSNGHIAADFIYPNPVTSERVWISTSWATDTAAIIKVFNVQGREICRQTTKMIKGKAELNVKGMESGTYLIELDNGKVAVSQKLVIQ